MSSDDAMILSKVFDTAFRPQVARVTLIYQKILGMYGTSTSQRRLPNSAQSDSERNPHPFDQTFSGIKVWNSYCDAS